jgi:hypothetical protein
MDVFDVDQVPVELVGVSGNEGVPGHAVRAEGRGDYRHPIDHEVSGVQAGSLEALDVAQEADRVGSAGDLAGLDVGHGLALHLAEVDVVHRRRDGVRAGGRGFTGKGCFTDR